MKKIIITLITLSTATIHCMEPDMMQVDGKNARFNIIFNNNNDGSVHAQQSAEQSTKATAASKAIQMSTQQMLSYMQQIQKSINKNTMMQIWQQGNEFWSKHSNAILGCICMSAYLGLCARIALDNHFLRRTDTWAAWKCVISKKELEEMPESKLCALLLADIQRRHINKQNPTDFLTPLISFMHAIELEQRRIEKYITITKWISRLRLLWFFPTNIQHIKRAHERLDRLTFVRQTFLTWSAQYKMGNAMRMAIN